MCTLLLGEIGLEVAVSGAAAGREEVDDAHPPLAGSLEPLHDSVAGTNACPGENRIMRAQNLSTSLGEGRDVAPSLALPSPKTKPGRLHKRIDTPRLHKRIDTPQ
jgi:hypothetical protein